MKSVVWLKDIGKDDSFAGEKGKKLGELKRVGFPVPDAFIITTDVYKSLVGSGLSKSIKNILDNLDVEKTSELEEASRKVQALIVSAQFPEYIESDIIETYRKLGGLVAVRSSATAEDLKDASFAGQLSTFLNVNEEELLKSVKKCIASLFTARAIYYMAQKNIDPMKVLIGVVVQKMVKAKKAGVSFSVNPVTNNREEIIIEAVSGLGEALVGGKSIPDNYIVLKRTGTVKESHAGKHILTDFEIKQLAEITKEIEAHYNFPQDIEWAIADKIYILQARPVTTLKTKKHVWKKILAREYGVQYTELSLRCLTPENKSIVPKPFYEQVYIPEDENEVCYIDESKWNEFVSSLKEKYLENPENYKEFERLLMEAGSEYTTITEKITENNLKDKTNSELKELYLGYLNKNLRYGPFIWMRFIVNDLFAENAKEIISEKLGKDNKNLFDYIEVALKPEKKAASVQLSEIASKWEKLDEDEKTATYEKFKWVPCLDIHNKPWTKEEFFSRITEFKKVEKKVSASYESAIERIKPSEKEKMILDASRRLSYLKDLTDDFRRRGIFFAQKLFEEIANRMGIKLEDISYMTESEIVAFLESKHKIPKRLIEERKKGFAIYFSPDKKLVCKSGEEIETALNELGIVILEEFSEEIKGTPASLGKAKGIVTIVKVAADLSKVKKGDILVAVTTHPDYVPAMQKAVAIVTDEGGITSHAAIVARELGLPCIVGAKHATKFLKDGDEVEVDADSGIVGKIKK